ncbi:hypothetical protein TCE0_042r15282 [Talaromyces pinophilus]|uniref:Uncharacterized protein n=1 Tax=Talaromyces pinophilus TaxID=128442 RepID=A0A6V8HLD6_TALPI|nr:hypothetical protein TCE0_042r15282 [Talaromyces pinophilus]
MTTPSEKIVLVPVRVDAFIFTSQKAENRAILAPITPPDYRSLRLENEFIRHDIFGAIDIRDIDLNGSYMAPRLWSSYPPSLTSKLESTTREGTFSYWSLPKMYRQSITTTPSAQSVHEKEVLRHGYKAAAAAAANVNAGGRLSSSSPTLSSSGHLKRDGFEYGDPSPPGIGSEVFVIERNHVRQVQETPPDDDLLTSTSAYIDPSRPLDDQGEMFLGCSWPLKDWIKDVAPSRSDLHFPDIERSLLKIQTLVQNTENTADSEHEAAELIATNNFIRHYGGTVWHLKKHPDGGTVQKPDDETLKSLRQTNLLQRMLDTCLMEAVQLKINLFEEFWIVLGRPEVMPPFIMQQDPTVLFAGIPSVRNEHSSGKSLLVRLGGQENTDDPSKNANWTVEYYHIHMITNPKTINWDFNFEAPEGESQYRIKPGKVLSNDPDIQGDFRILSGRSPILQQASNLIQTLLKQLFSRVNPDELDLILTPTQREGLLADRGTHLQPNSLDDEGLKSVLDEIGLGTPEATAPMDFASPYTPFASLIPIPADPTKYNPFKPCTHGQFRFTKLLVVDKFGQVITPINVFKPNTQNQSTPVQATHTASTLSPMAPQTPFYVLQTPNCRSSYNSLQVFTHLPRLNADYVRYEPNQKGWCATDEWENPVCGWIAVNFPDYSIQVLDQEGHFIREFQVMNASAVSYPFEPLETLPDTVSRTLRDLMRNLSNALFLEGLFDTLCAAGESVKHPPNSYAETNASLKNQSAIAPLDPNLDKLDTTSNKFSMKLGDKDNTLDGLVGYFSNKDEDHDPEAFEMDSFYSYFAASTTTTDGDPIKPIQTRFTPKPYYLDPADKNLHNANQISFTEAHDARREVIAAIMGPFVALDEKNVSDTTGGNPVPVAVRKEEWVWLQPYYLQSQDDDPKKGGEAKYNFWTFKKGR